MNKPIVKDKIEDQDQSGKSHEMKSLYQSIAFATREADKIINRLGFQPDKKNNSHQNHQTSNKKNIPILKESVLGKYNYYGKKYRFEEKQDLLNIAKPEIQRSCRTSKSIEKNKNSKEPQIKTQQDINYSMQAQIDQSAFFDDGKIQFPTQNYYICFQQPKNKKKKNMIRPQIKQQTVPNKFKPAWLMQKKINALQKQVKELKERDRVMGATMQSVLLQTNPSVKKMRKSTDFPINIKSNVERMIDSLWK